MKKRSKERSKEKNNENNKENKCYNHPMTVYSSINTEVKKIKCSSKGKINESFNYGRVQASKSIEKSINPRPPQL